MVDSDHTCHTISINTLLPHKKWRENYLNCRTCKRSLVVLLGNFFLQNASEYLASHQSMYIAGAFENDIADTMWFVTSQTVSNLTLVFPATLKKLIPVFGFMSERQTAPKFL